jgi:outer membrane PBP1 activator LpoA protein
MSLFSLLIAGCASVSVAPVESAQEQAAAALLREGKYSEAAQAYQAFATGVRSPIRDRAMVRAADAWERADDTAAARQALAQSNRRKLTGDDAFLHDVLSAQFLFVDGRAAEALALLNQSNGSVPAAEQVRWHSLRARVFQATGMNFELAGEYARLAEGLSSKESAASARNIQRLLGTVDSHALAAKSAALVANDSLYPFAAHELSKRGLPLPHPYQPRSSTLTSAFPAAEPDGYRPPTRLAVLLPRGNFSSASAGVRDGILAAYYGEHRRRPTIKFYDSTGTADGARKALAKAVAEGAQMIIGPLAREEVSGVFENDRAGVPIIALNRGQNPPPPGNASFALLPDEEGFAAADRLADRGLLNVLVLTQNEDNAQRALAAFREQLRVRGGKVVAEIIVNDNPTELAAQIAKLSATAQAPPSAIFLTMKAAPARMVAAQLSTSTLAALPRVASSLILNGGGISLRLDAELDGIEYPELPWLLDAEVGLPDASAIVGKLSSTRGPARRLFAFGYDAYQLAVYFDRLGSDPGFSLRGATGELRLDTLGLMQREPMWAVFSGGRPHRAPDHVPVPNAAGTP